MSRVTPGGGASNELLVIGPNPAIDRILDVPAFRVGAVMRSRHSLCLAGGKPINVARVLRRLSVPCTLVVPLGGRGPSALVERACRSLGVDLRAVPISEETRTCVVIVDSDNGSATVVNEPGPRLNAAEVAALEAASHAAMRPGAIAVLSGSLTPGTPAALCSGLAEAARRLDVRVVVDVAGEPLRVAIEAGSWCVKVNADEAASVTGESDPLRAAAALSSLGVPHVVVTCGAQGAYYVGGTEHLHVRAPVVRTVNPTGAGDAFLAGMLSRLRCSDSWPDALRTASAVAATVAGLLGPDPGDDPITPALLAEARITAV